MKRTYQWADKKSLTIGQHTLVMGILNVTPDSFSDGGKWDSLPDAIRHLQEMIEVGADIIDIGAESSRPGFVPMSAAAEIARLQTYLPEVLKASTVPVSVDTFKAETADWALQQGAHIINDIWGLQGDPRMAEVVAAHNVPVIVMHNQDGTVYEADIIEEMARFFEKSIAIAKDAGIAEENIVLDPGIGFGKTPAQCLEVVRRMSELTTLFPYPWLLAVSRKRFIGEALDLPVTEREEGTAAACLYGQMAGCHIVRVHRVKEMVRMMRMIDIITGKVTHGKD